MSTKWLEREPIIRQYAGKISGEAIARMLGMNASTLRHQCKIRNINLKCQKATNHTIAKVKAEKRAAKMLEANSPVTLKINIESLWMIPSSSGHRMGNFTP